MMNRIITACLVAVAPVLSATAAKTFSPLNSADFNMQARMRCLAPSAAKQNKHLSSALKSQELITPDFSMGSKEVIYDIDGPDGSLWYCTTELKSSVIEHELYDEFILQEYAFTIYDSNFNVVGTIRDKMRYQENEVRVPGPSNGISIMPQITRHYFNSDDKLEVVVALAVNTTTPGINNYRSVIYQIDGEKETVSVVIDGNTETFEADKPISQLDSFVADVINLSTPDKETIYMTFESSCGDDIDIDWDKLDDGDEEEGKKYWQMLSTSGLRYEMFAKADADGNLVKIFDKEITYQRMQGDQESSPTFVTTSHNGDIYIALPYYKETFFNPFYSWTEDMTMRESNSLVIELYRITDTGSELLKTTELPVQKGEGDYVLATYYSVGDLRYDRDVQFLENGDPSYLITRCNYTTVSDDTSGYCYYTYDVNGNRTSTIFENAEAVSTLNDIEGCPDQALFVIYDDDEGYNYHIVDLYNPTSENNVKINYLLNDDILGFNVDRACTSAGYGYAFEMRYPHEAEDGRSFMRIAWFNADGSFNKIDYIDMGRNVNYATAYIDGQVLDNKFICADDANEYLVLVKRAVGTDEAEANEELIVAQGASSPEVESHVFLHIEPCEKGSLSAINLYPDANDEKGRLMIGYNNSETGTYTADFYDLPFEYSGIETPGTDKETVAKFDGKEVIAEGLIRVYSTTGTLVAKGNNRCNVESLAKGIYIADTDGGNFKFVVK